MGVNFGRAHVVSILLSKGTNPYDRDIHGNTSFDFARTNNKNKVIFILRKWHITMVIMVLLELGFFFFEIL